MCESPTRYSEAMNGTWTLAELEATLREAWSPDTSYEPSAWTLVNPAAGQCAVTALVIQDHLGGEIVRAIAEQVEHYWNRFRGSEDVDLTGEQFAAPPTWSYGPTIVDRDSLLANENTKMRYEIFRRRTSDALMHGTSIDTLVRA